MSKMIDGGAKAEIAAEDQAAVFDVSDLEERCLGNLELLVRILAQVETEVERECQRLCDAVEQADVSLVATAAHRLKGTAANIGATRLQKAADSLEQASRTSAATSQLEAMCERVQEERDRLVEAVNRHVSGPTSGSEG